MVGWLVSLTQRLSDIKLSEKLIFF